uniref:Uncharacterized protein n=1 Tax=Dunaliella tertiolecta TaxID=3047 RepID=A0A7S3VMH9_DUNTE
MEATALKQHAHLTRAGPTPTNISWKSEPEMDRKGTPASPAVALASKVLPDPGGPTNRAPLGSLAPRILNLSGFCRNCTNSMISICGTNKCDIRMCMITRVGSFLIREFVRPLKMA